MSRTAVWRVGTAAVLAFVVAGCTSTSAGQAVPEASGVASTSTAGTAAPSGAADGTDVAACFDGQCEIAVSGPIAIPLDPKFRAEGLTVDRIGARNLTIKVQNSGGSSTFSVNQGGTSTYNGIRLQLVRISGGSAVLAVSPA